MELGETSSSISVATAVNESCSTAIVRGLAKQIAEEVDCMAPDSLARFSATTRVRFSSNAVLPYMHPRAKADLLRAADDASLQVNSGYRTVVQQYLLYRWFRAGRCGIRAAALPGRSNHESGRAVDLANWSTRVGVMGSHHWAHDVPGDPVHFDHTLSPDNRGKDVRAFQRLWNRNHPGDLISVDGVYGPQTAARVRRAPAKGFRKGPLCRAIEPGADVLAIDGPDRMAPESVAAYAITVANNDTVDWPATTRVVAAGGLPSVLYDPETWVSPTEVGTIGGAIAGNGGDGQFTIALRAPAVAEETTVETTLALVDGTRQIGTIDLAVIVTPNGDEETSGDAGETDEVDADSDVADEDGVVEAGCNAGGASGGSSAVLVALGLAVAGARRRRR
ncbi:MAG TPA: M15 family metallopeptidase [Kofleriaceae bacterium]|nr:M15 family metallopeptidase [Kofleriaceae bacterium]